MSSISRACSIVGDRKEGRPSDDFYPTPPEATRALLKVEKFGHVIWEPACGDGAISEVLFSSGYDVVSTDLNSHGYGKPDIDFLKTDLPYANTIITNPPFTLAEEFIEHAHKLKVVKMALLLKLSALEGRRRSEVMRKTHLTRIHVFENRLTMTRNGEKSKNGGMIAFAWFVWEHGYQGAPTLGWIRCGKQPGQPMLFGG